MSTILNMFIIETKKTLLNILCGIVSIGFFIFFAVLTYIIRII